MPRLLSYALVFIMFISLAACKKPGETGSASDEAMKKYILAHPEVLVQSLSSYEQKQAEDESKKAEAGLKTYHKDIFANPASPVVGDKDAPNTIVEFFDYNCHYCKGILPDLKKLTAEDKDVKIIFKELPFLGPTSASTAVAALIVWDIAPDKYFAFHTALMEHNGPADDGSIEQAARKAGIDPAVLEQKFKDKKYQDELRANSELAQNLGISGTPTFIINGKVARGALRYQNIKQMLAGKAN